MKKWSLGIYISVPFCRTKCSYCNFASDVFSRAVFERYVDRVCADISNAPPDCAKQMGGKVEREVDSIYLGGGTPTVLTGAIAAGVRCGARPVRGAAGCGGYGRVRSGNLDAGSV